MYLMFLAMTMVLMIMGMLSMLILMISKKSNIDNQKITPFECGFNPMSYNRLPFSIHFFLVAVIFLIFDVEIIMIMPMVMTIKTAMVKKWMLTSMLFIIILILGLMHEWNNGMIEWTK